MSTPLNKRIEPPAGQTPASPDSTQVRAESVLANIRHEADSLRLSQQQDFAALRAEMAAELAAVRETLALVAPPALMPSFETSAQDAPATVDSDSADTHKTEPLPDAAETSTSRRTLLKWGGLAAAAGLAAAGGATLTSPTAHASAGSDGGNLVLGSTINKAEHVTELTYDGAETNPVVFRVSNGAADSRGIDANAGGGTTATTAGVYSTAEANGRGIRGGAIGNDGFGLWGSSASGYGVVGNSTTGIDLAAAGTGRLLQVPMGIVGAPKSGTYLAGEQMRDVYGNLFICVTGGSPGVWRKAVARNVGYKNGTIKFLPTPIRVYDSRKTGGPLVGNAKRDIQVAGVVIGGVQVPAGSVGCIGNLTVTSPSAGGYLVIYPQGSPTPTTSTVNFLTHQTVANSFAVGLSTGGQVTVHSFTSGQCHFIVDITGYIASLS